MDRSKASPLASSPVAAKPESPRLRRKLQKGGGKQRNYLTKRPGSGASNDASADDKAQNANKSSPPLLPPDLSDSRWPEYLRGRGYLCALDSTVESRETLASPISTIPDLYHSDTKYETERARIDKIYSVSPSSSPPSPIGYRAKTPALTTAQLEAASTSRAASAPGKASSVELIAEQYRALLESRDSMYTDSHSEPPPSRQEVESPLGIKRQHSSGDLQEAASSAPQPAAGVPTGSPTSDDETLVAFEEETVYFKPVSFSPEPLSPINNFEQPFFSPPLAPESLSLQICVDLLTRDLTSAITDKPRRHGPDSSALQVWVMIEAYERLRDQVLDLRLRYDEIRSLELMFDMWLRSLYAIHDSLTGDGRTSDGDYEELELTAEGVD
jgi:hypothetical protein